MSDDVDFVVVAEVPMTGMLGRIATGKVRVTPEQRPGDDEPRKYVHERAWSLMMDLSREWRRVAVYFGAKAREIAR